MRGVAPYPAMILACLLAATMASAADVRPEAAPADSIRAIPDDAVSAEALRGTGRPLPRRISPLRHAARGVLFVPYLGMRAAVWPITTLARLDEQHGLVDRLAGLIIFRSGSYRTTAGPLLGFESSLGITGLGVHVRGRDWLGTGSELKLGLGYVNSRRNLAAAGFEREGGRLAWELSVRQENLEDRPFYGIGPDSPERRTDYNARLRLVEAEVKGWPVSRWQPELTVYLRDLELKESTSAHSMSDVYPDRFAASRRGRYAGAELELTRDTRNARDYSSSGTLVRAQGGRHAGLVADNPDYWSYEGELQAYLGVMGGSRSFLLRALAVGVALEGDGVLPISELARLGGKGGLRGYDRYRFADRRSLLLTAAYRYPVTSRVTGEVFVDWGAVAPVWSDLSLGDIDPAYGLGLMVRSKYGPLLSFHIAGSSEGVQVAVGTTSIFKTGSRRKP